MNWLTEHTVSRGKQICGQQWTCLIYTVKKNTRMDEQGHKGIVPKYIDRERDRLIDR